MKDFTVRRLSDYKTDDLRELEMLLSIAYQAGKVAKEPAVMQAADSWCYVLRDAMKEQRNAGIYGGRYGQVQYGEDTPYEELDDDNQMAFI
jgi:hypothetical protein